MLFFPDGECGAEWLTKTINDTFIENMKNRLNADIHKFSFVPDMTDVNFASNASGVAIKYKLIGLEQIRSRKERFFKKAIQRRIELILGFYQCWIMILILEILNLLLVIIYLLILRNCLK